MSSSTVYLQGCKDMAPVHSVICFVELQKNHKEWILVDASQLLSKFKIQGGHPSSPPCTESVEDFMEYYT